MDKCRRDLFDYLIKKTSRYFVDGTSSVYYPCLILDEEGSWKYKDYVIIHTKYRNSGTVIHGNYSIRKLTNG